MKLAVFALLLVVLPFQAEAGPPVCDTLYVTVKKGFNLYGDFPGLPDPYVKVTVDRQTKKTHDVSNNDNPVWNKEFKYTNVRSDKLVIEIWEYDTFLTGADDHLGTCVEKLAPGYRTVWCKGRESGAVVYQLQCLKGNMKKKQLTTAWDN